MRMKRYVRPQAVIAMLAALLVMMALFSGAQSQRVSALENQVSAGYQKAFYETVKLMGSIEVNLEKLIITLSSSQQQDLLTAIARQADSVLADLAVLPSEEDSISSTIKFVNQAGDFARTVNERLSAGGALTEDDQITIETLYAHCVGINERLSIMAAEIESGATPLVTATSLAPAPEPSGEQDEADVTVEYPVLLYDGPFSDGRDDGAFKALGGGEIDADRAQQVAVDFIGQDRIQSIRPTGENQVPVACYELDVETADGTLSIAITKQGGQVLYMLTSQDVTEMTQSEASCADLAAQFLKSRGYEGMQVNYWQKAGGLLTVNFAATQAGVVLYPDLIKVQVSMKSGMVVGFEAKNYLANHVMRTLDAPAITQEQANALISSRLTIERSRLCVIPLEVGEAYCYEFSVKMDEAQYLIYIDAHTGEERTIMKVVVDEDGQLAI